MRALRTTVAAVVTGLGLSLAFATAAHAQPDCDVPDPPPICDREPPDPPPDPAPTYSPVLFVDGARQAVTRDGIRVWGWTADADAPRTPLTVRLTVDGVAAGTRTADLSRPDVGAAYPFYGPLHGFDVVLPASAAGHTVCVTAVNAGSGSDTGSCRRMSEVTEFLAHGIDYDYANAVMAGSQLDSKFSADVSNATDVEQTSTVTRTVSTTDTQGWSDTLGIKVSVATEIKAGIPIFQGGIKVSIEGSYSFTRNGSTSKVSSWQWTQPVKTPPRSRVVAEGVVTRYTVIAPYTLTGTFVYDDGARLPGTTTGTFVGTNNTDFEVRFTQYDLDGLRSADPVEQPAESLRVKRLR
ncbi:ETX/MTX2 family pore-forming toxin [Paractinoplanes rishiriensis]|uniref:Uncharacterized protein n=1 Tax=Paractinoplanes rishiriensis TaxID=1050105 RepID=A0A919JTK2_9ACTN|nr:ETX/MTX2 family pore-forming toxin [Actinoplanes rishiriensis]GIE94560.1 hypothetical protein Ari01nite_20250 [Actinoplanes rishiriensis]